MRNHKLFRSSRCMVAAMLMLLATVSVGCGGTSSGSEDRKVGDCYFETVGQSQEELKGAIDDAMNGLSFNSGCATQAGLLADVARVDSIEEPSPHFRVWLRFRNSPAP